MLDEQGEAQQKAFEKFCREVFQIVYSGKTGHIVSISEYVKPTGIPRKKPEAVCQAMGLVVHEGRGPFGHTAGLP
jgi:hypothetical protein